MSSAAVQKIIELCLELSEEDLSVVLQEIELRQLGFESTEPTSIRDVVPIDSPIGSSIDKVSGDLYIRYPNAIGLGRCIGLKEVRITPEGQIVLAQILRDSLSNQALAARIPPKPTSLQ
jgi:hypothetical protein